MSDLTRRQVVCGIITCALTLRLMAALAAAPTATIEVSAPDRDYNNYPMTVAVAAPSSARSATLTDAGSGQTVACQLWRDGDNALLTWIIADLKKGSSRRYTVAFSETAPAPGDGVVIRQGDDAAEILIG